MTGAAGHSTSAAMQAAIRPAAADSSPAGEDRFRAAFFGSPVAMAIVGPDRTIVEINQRFCELLGRPSHEVIGRTFAQFTHPEDLECEAAALERAMLDGSQRVVLEKRYLRGDGSPVWVRLHAALQRNPHGHASKLIVHAEDIAAERRTAEALAQREAQYRTLVEHAPEAIMVVDADAGKFVDVNRNAEQLFKMTRAQLLKVGPADIAPRVQPDGASTRQSQRERVERALRGHTETYERVLRDAEGREFYCEIRLVRLPSSHQRLVRASIIEISERKRAEERRQRLMRELNHRVKNTLASILTLARQSITRARTLEEFDRGFTGRLTAMSRAHEALTSGQWEPIEVGELARLVLGPHLFGHKPQIHLGGDGILLQMRAVVPLAMALHELATNAIKHGALSRDSGRVHVSWTRCDDTLELRWREQGGPPVSLPLREGTGTELLRGFIAYELDGEVHFNPAPDCFECTLHLPLNR